MSNPTPVVDFADDLAAFLSRTNQFGESNQDLIQQKFNKKQADGSVNPVFAALESRSRSLAQWANLVDDFMLQYFTQSQNSQQSDIILPLSFNTGAGLVYLGLVAGAEASGIANANQQFIAPVALTIVEVVLHCIDTNYGTTVVATHIDENVAVLDSDSQTFDTTSGIVTWTLGTAVAVDERLSISFDGQFAGGQGVGNVILRPT